MSDNKSQNNKQQKKKNNEPEKRPSIFQNPLFVFLGLSILAVILLTPESGENIYKEKAGVEYNKVKNKITYYDLKKMIKNNQIEYIGMADRTLSIVKKSNTNSKEVFEIQRVYPDTTLIPLLEEHNVDYGGINEHTPMRDMLLVWLIPIAIFIIIFLLITKSAKKMGGGSGGIFNMGSSKKVINSEKPNVKFTDMAGNKEAKEEVSEIVDFLKNPDRYIKLGAQIPKGVLLVGPPGTGKTLLAKAVAGESEGEFLSVTGSSFIEMFVGVGASRVRDLFTEAKKVAPAIIFIDEIDAIGKSRANGGQPGGGNDEREQTLNQLLAEMDGFNADAEAPVIVLAATNRPEVLDPALLRPGRFDRQVLVDKPDLEGRLEILKVHIKGVLISNKVDLKEVATMTAGLAGADLANIVNEAALLAGREGAEEVKPCHFKESIERQIAGLEKKSRRISPKEKEIVAYHESGHALIAEITKGANKVNKVSIIPRGRAALGYTLNTPEEDKYLIQKHELIAEIDVLLGGRAAEEVFIGEISTGASNDLERATEIVKSMASIYGMTEVAGLMVLRRQQNTYLGGGSMRSEYSDSLENELDQFIKNTLNQRYEIVKEKLVEYKEVMEEITQELLKIEIISGEKVREIIENNGKEYFKGEDLHNESIKEPELKD